MSWSRVPQVVIITSTNLFFIKWIIAPRVPVAQISAGNERNFTQPFSLIIASKISKPTATFFAVNPPASPNWFNKSLADNFLLKLKSFTDCILFVFAFGLRALFCWFFFRLILFLAEAGNSVFAAVYTFFYYKCAVVAAFFAQCFA